MAGKKSQVKLVASSPEREALAARLSKNIGTRRRALGLTQAQLAELLDTDTESLARYERGNRLPTLANLERISNTLLTSVAELLEQPKLEESEAGKEISVLVSSLRLEDQQLILDIVRSMHRRLHS